MGWLDDHRLVLNPRLARDNCEGYAWGGLYLAILLTTSFFLLNFGFCVSVPALIAVFDNYLIKAAPLRVSLNEESELITQTVSKWNTISIFSTQCWLMKTANISELACSHWANRLNKIWSQMSSKKKVWFINKYSEATLEGNELYFEKREHWAKLSNPMFKRGITDLKVIYYLEGFF